MGTDGPSIDAMLLAGDGEREGWWERGKEKKSDETLHCRALLKIYWKKRQLFFYAHFVYRKSD